MNRPSTEGEGECFETEGEGECFETEGEGECFETEGEGECFEKDEGWCMSDLYNLTHALARSQSRRCDQQRSPQWTAFAVRGPQVG